MYRLKIIAITSHDSRWHCANREIALTIIAVALNFREARLHKCSLATADCSRTNSSAGDCGFSYDFITAWINEGRERKIQLPSSRRLSRFRSTCCYCRDKSRVASLTHHKTSYGRLRVTLSRVLLIILSFHLERR